MFDPKQILDLLDLATKEQWPYPKSVSALKEVGVLWYECDVATDTLIYHGEHGKTVQGVDPVITTPLLIADQFNEEELKKAIAIRLSKDISRLEFLTLIAAAGVATYKSDMLARTITFRGRYGGEYVLHIPS